MKQYDMASDTLPDDKTVSTSRRGFLAGAAGLVIALSLPGKGRAQQAVAASAQTFEPNAFIRIAPDNTIRMVIKHIEFGQGPFTGLSTILADEMDADWDMIVPEHAPSNPQLYANADFGMQITGGSSAIRTSWDAMRQAGASAKAMLIAAAAAEWGVPAGEVTASNSVLSHAASGRSATYGDMAAAAAQQQAPENPTLKTPNQFVYIGKGVRKLDTLSKTNGSAEFTIDLYRDGMLTAVVAHPPKFGATVASFDDTAARAVSGVSDVRQISSGVAVYATNTYAALKGREALSVEWDETNAETRSSDEIIEDLRERAAARGTVAADEGNVDEALGQAEQVIEAEYVFPYLAHAPMEPLDGVIERRADGGIEAWMGAQSATSDHQAIAQVCGVDMSEVQLNIMLAGGSFGRRATPASEFAVEVAEAFMAIGGETPVKLIWTREDDIKGGYYRPVTVHRMRGGLDADGNITAWEQTVSGQSFAVGTPFESFMISDGIDGSMLEGAGTLPYALANRNTSLHYVGNPVPTLWWRSVGHTHTAYSVEVFLDELLAAGGKDPVEGRLALMENAPRLAETLRTVADIAGWGRSLPPNRALGVASAESFQSYVSQIAEVSIEDGLPKVHKVWCAVDCGIAVNPEIIKAQMEGGIGYGLGAILFNEVTMAPGGGVQQSNFHDYRSLRISEMPEIEVAIVPSDAAPTGVGEPGTPPIGPAVANAVRALRGQPPRRLPMIFEASA